MIGPSHCSPGEQITLLLEAATATVAYVLNPNRAEIDLTSRLQVLTTPNITGTVLVDMPMVPGQYFYKLTAGASSYYHCVTCSAWAGNMDLPISTVRHQRTDIDRLNASIIRKG